MCPAKHLTPRMQFIVLATDYDGTLACDGRVDRETIEALNRLRASGRKLLLVTGRHLPDLQSVFPQLELFERVVAENGGLLYRPATREEKLLAKLPMITLSLCFEKETFPLLWAALLFPRGSLTRQRCWARFGTSVSICM